MEQREYERLARVEDRMWWFRGLHARLIATLARRLGAPKLLLDAGCGTGGLMARLAQHLPESGVLGIDLDQGAAQVAKAKSARPVLVGSVDRLPFRDRSLDAILSADVLCHAGVDERAALGEFRRCLRPGGVLVLNLPAYPWLLSAHDVAVANVRRYRRPELRRLLAAAGFAGLEIGYWNSLLFPLMVLRRKLSPGSRSGAASDVALLPPLLERAFAAILVLELGLGRAGITLPFGGSLLASAVKA